MGGFMKTTILVTGATGFVGSHVLESLSTRADIQVIAACREPSRLLPEFSGEIRAGDLRDAAYLQDIVKGVDVICHAAAWTSLWGHAQESHELFLEPTLALIEAAQASGVKRFINTSTTSAAAPTHSADAMNPGIPHPFWPHLCNVVAIENVLRAKASPTFQIVNLRLGIFAGRHYALGVLPILVPRLRTHLVPWVAGGRTSLPIIDGRDIGLAFTLAGTAKGLQAYESFNIVGPVVPSVRQVISFIHEEFGLPKPHFGVPFALAYPFAWLMEKLDPLVPWEPLVTRSIIHLLEEVHANNERAEKYLGYRPLHSWQEAVRTQMEEMKVRQTGPMSMARPVT